MNTVLALMAKVMTAIRGHMTRSEWRISFCKDKESTPLFRSCRSSVWFSKCSIHEDIYIFTTVEFVVDFEETHLINSSDEKYHTYINDNDVTLCIFYATYIDISILSKCSYLLVLINKLSCPPGHQPVKQARPCGEMWYWPQSCAASQAEDPWSPQGVLLVCGSPARGII